jgi:3-carboxy-cis,cis-muconate cycloisomerase
VRRCSLPFEGLFVPDSVRDAVSDQSWLDAMLEAEVALAAAEAKVGVISPEAAAAVAAACESVSVAPGTLAVEGRRAGNPVEPLVRALRTEAPFVHHGATSQDILDTAAALITRRALALVLAEVDEVGGECARLAQEHRSTVMAGRTLLQRATPTTFGLKAAGWLAALVQARALLAEATLPAQLGGASGTLAALGDDGLQVSRLFAAELGLDEPVLPWHAVRFPLARLGAALSVLAATVEKVALDVLLLAQTEVGEVREADGGVSSTMPHKRNPVGATLARACALRARAAAGPLVSGAHEHERAAGAWHAEWGSLADGLALTGGAVAALRASLRGLDVDAERMRANIQPAALSEAERFFPGRELAPEEYLGAAAALVDRALALHRRG